MILYFIPAEHRYVHRQTDVPKGFDFKKVDVPTSQADLMGFLNDLWSSFMIDLNAERNKNFNALMESSEDAIAKAREALEEPAKLVTTVCGNEVLSVTKSEIPPITKSDISSDIMDTPADKFGLVLSSTLERLGELRKDGWDGLRPFLKNNPAAERGIGALFAGVSS